MKKYNLLYFLVLIFFLGLVFQNWIFSTEIIGGDWPYFYQENINIFTFLPPAWSPIHGNGFGATLLVYSIDSYLYFTGWLFSNILHIPWNIVYKLVWFGMFLFLGGFSIYHLFKELVPKLPLPYILIGIFLFLANTYILLVVGGGQMGVALGYALAPLVITRFIKVANAVLSDKKVLNLSLIAGLVFSLQVLFDFRMAYISMIAVMVYVVFVFIFQPVAKKIQKILPLILYPFFIPVVLALLLHAFWILPFAFTGQSSVEQLGSGYTSAAAVKFFSFAKFENTIGLLHPNWPENIFGKVGFMKAEFLLLPLLAFLSLVFLAGKKKGVQEKIAVLYVSLLALIAIFLAKGANDPFGSVYLWMFDTIPGFVMFRDPTKWYTLIAISYSVLVPYGVWSIYQFIKSKKLFSLKPQVFNLQNIFIVFVIGLMIFLIRPAMSGNLGGTFATHTVSEDYIQLKDMLVTDDQFYRTLWVPKMQRFTYTSQNHPGVEANVLLKATNSADIIKQLKRNDSEKKLSALSIKYVIVPFDSEKELFLKDRKYNASERELIVKELDKISWLQRDTKFKNLTIYQIKNHKDHLWLSQNGTISYTRTASIEYQIKLQTTEKNKLIFNENYSPYWTLHVGDEQLQSKSYNGMNSFDIPKMQGDVTLVYSLQQFFEIGRIISLTTFVLVLVLLLFLKNRKSKIV